MPQIDQLVDATAGHPRMSFLDAYWELPLQGNAVWPEERRVHLSKDDDKNVRATVRLEHRNLC